MFLFSMIVAALFETILDTFKACKVSIELKQHLLCKSSTDIQHIICVFTLPYVVQSVTSHKVSSVTVKENIVCRCVFVFSFFPPTLAPFHQQLMFLYLCDRFITWVFISSFSHCSLVPLLCSVESTVLSGTALVSDVVNSNQLT